MLHIHNGESSAVTARQSNIEGEHVAQQEALIDGPAPEGLSEEQWRHTRADHLANAYNLSKEDCDDSLKKQQEMLASFAYHDEIILWFEHDLFCQANLLYLLSWFARRELGGTKLSLICIDKFPGIDDFRGLGQLNEAKHELSR